ncbi:MAG: hypothetical protein DI598_07315 [Pseudopedobacter saltans]|uniref:Substrate import-associated zinc metallohydrolase lipoprotein n=1 Tax=Pseudopedobacter saltans TaxID=151895 RepID=A0A2W5H761_9SPHI|nr:MAG: hypothetical protein DI598_07315 [Pseudopedobacter saltans]
MRKILFLGLLFTTLFSCRKSDENLDISMSDYPLDIPKTSAAIDAWLDNNFNKPWNINVEYRFDAYETDINRSISPISLDRIQPVMQAMLDCFIGPYKTVAGETFGKIYFPKQWCLYGSYSYNTDGSRILGTASSARRVNIYNLNNINLTTGDDVATCMRTLHHEFTHCLNQTYPIPAAFQLISAANYDPVWTNKSDALVRDLGFVNPYSSSSYEEDFAEIFAHIVVRGPIWYSNWLNQASASGRAALKAKEAIVYDYLMNYFNIDLYKLQSAVQNVLRTKYNYTQPEDITLQFPYRLANGSVNTITMDTTATYNTTYGKSALFMPILRNYASTLRGGNWYMRSIQFIFNSSSSMTFRVGFTQGATGTTLYNGDYNFNYTTDPITGLVTFTKAIPEGSGTTYNNGQITAILSGFETYILPYLTNRQFVAAYLPTGITSTSPLYRTYAGFYVNGTSTNYFYGPVTYK